MVRGNNRQRIFHDDRFFEHFLKVLGDSSNKFDHSVLAYCLMSNHAHLIIKVNESSLSNIMQNVNYRFARWSNRMLKRIGHLFQGRYRSIDVGNEEYLVNLLRYIHYNPVAAKIVEHVKDYVWSSHRYYVSLVYPEWLNVGLMLDILEKKVGVEYGCFMDNDVPRKCWRPAFYLKDNGEMVIDDALIDMVAPSPDVHVSRKYIATDRVVEIICNKLNVSRSDILGLSRERMLSKKRALLARYLLSYSEMNLSQIANYLQRTHATLTRQINRLGECEEGAFTSDILQEIGELLKKEV